MPPISTEPTWERKRRKRLQKAVNHLNKAFLRLAQLDEMEIDRTEVVDCNAFYELSRDVRAIKRRLLFAAEVRGVRVDPGGMPK